MIRNQSIRRTSDRSYPSYPYLKASNLRKTIKLGTSPAFLLPFIGPHRESSLRNRLAVMDFRGSCTLTVRLQGNPTADRPLSVSAEGNDRHEVIWGSIAPFVGLQGHPHGR